MTSNLRNCSKVKWVSWSFTCMQKYFLPRYMKLTHEHKNENTFHWLWFLTLFFFKVQIFWEGHKNFPIFHLLLDATKQCLRKSGRWDKILGFSQTIWTLISHNKHQRKWKLSNFCGLINDSKKFMKTFEKNRIKNACSERIQPQLSRNLSSIELS